MARILIVDDDDLIRCLLREILEGEKHEVVEACNGREGLERYWAEPTDLVITDMLMPEKNGLELIQALRRDFPTVKIIAIFGSNQRFWKPVMQLGVQRAFSKPFQPQEICHAVRELVLCQNVPGFQQSLHKW